MDENDLDALPPSTPKVDPETLVLRGPPRPAARFRRSVVIGSIAVVSLSLIGLTWIALEPVTFRQLAEGSSGRPFEQVRPDALTNAPRDYRDIPKLGPPLPGDLGRPILEQQRQMVAEQVPVPDAYQTRGDEGRDLRQQRVAQEQATRGSALVVQLAGKRDAPGQPAQAGEETADQPASPRRVLDAKVSLGDWGTNSANAHELLAPSSRYVIAAGSVIPASLITGLNSDLPGLVVGEVTENVRDSATGRTILIPQGARLIGKYDEAARYGQKRAFLIWQRIVFPDGSSLRLDNMPASDASGYAGVSDRVDSHGWQLLKGVILSSILGVGSQLSLGAEGDLIRAVRQSIQQNGSQAGEQMVAKGLSVQPTIKVRPGWPVRVLVSEDLVLKPWEA